MDICGQMLTKTMAFDHFCFLSQGIAICLWINRFAVREDGRGLEAKIFDATTGNVLVSKQFLEMNWNMLEGHGAKMVGRLFFVIGLCVLFASVCLFYALYSLQLGYPIYESKPGINMIVPKILTELRDLGKAVDEGEGAC
jgi:hypothetical protein